MARPTNRISERRVPCLFLPFVIVWRLLAKLVELAGRLMLLAIGFVLMVVGVLLTLTVVGAIVGVPLVGLGIILIVRSLF